jgi:hypothetical protein
MLGRGLRQFVQDVTGRGRFIERDSSSDVLKSAEVKKIRGTAEAS